ncbi:hypothetical protein HDV00_007740 [Rhizophlyctis rosea]|nr:hypothetical protein HDV00_007740 [Rhizophlyctis rosea]
MHLRSALTVLAALGALMDVGSAHPEAHDEAEFTRQAAEIVRRNLAAKRCSEQVATMAKRTITKRSAYHAALRKRSTAAQASSVVDLVKRWEPHYASVQNNTCITVEETEEGPYYLSGELIRQNITETQLGVPLYFTFGLMNTDTCTPLPNAHIDIWLANALGTYSGFAAENTANQTYLRGIQATNSEGIAEFLGIFPGWYSGLATHLHTQVHIGATETDQGILTGGTVAHTGRLYFPEDLTVEVNQLSPYSENAHGTRVKNSEDRLYAVQGTGGYNPEFAIVKLGDTLSDGLLGYITLGVSASASNNNGQVQGNAPSGNGTMPAGNGTFPGGAGNGTFPSGMPSGAISSSVLPSGTPPSNFMPTATAPISTTTVTPSAGPSTTTVTTTTIPSTSTTITTSNVQTTAISTKKTTTTKKPTKKITTTKKATTKKSTHTTTTIKRPITQPTQPSRQPGQTGPGQNRGAAAQGHPV